MIQSATPIIIDLGKKKKKVIKRFKRGRGRVMDEVQQAIEDVRAGMGNEAEGKELIPVVLIYRKKQRRGGGFLGM